MRWRVSAGDFAHVRLSAYETKDPYRDVIVHEAAHLLHYLKPTHYGLHVRRGQERFVVRILPSRAIRVCVRGL